ncbi:21340_t:CDS:2 [Cetraspora pellucida]|uniref:21340_t:CDS:1 n=1 Tax=Cetraspora pellucida TaxID=1433469 RepID=A0A9N9A6T2_9GLOM|nr:21340_t:CDS:2 [Cetraspora pellucida]
MRLQQKKDLEPGTFQRFSNTLLGRLLINEISRIKTDLRALREVLNLDQSVKKKVY